MSKLPGVNHLDAVHIFEKAGFRIIRQGKHIPIICTAKELLGDDTECD